MDLNYIPVKLLADEVQELLNRVTDTNEYSRQTQHYIASIWMETERLAQKIKALEKLDGGDIGEEEFINRITGRSENV